MIRKLLYPVGLIIFVGCTDGVLYQMKRANPYYRAQWKKDQEYGATFAQRLDELKLLQNQLPSMSPADQLAWANRLEQIISKDASPEFRSQAVKTIAVVRSEATVRSLTVASTDASEKVRLTACRAWRQLGGPEARDMLLTLAVNQSESTSVRQAAVESLADFDEPEVNQTLANLLDDRSPAVQFQVTRSLAKITGREFGGDLASWRDYMNGQEVAEPSKSLTATILNSVQFWR